MTSLPCWSCQIKGKRSAKRIPNHEKGVKRLPEERRMPHLKRINPCPSNQFRPTNPEQPQGAFYDSPITNDEGRTTINDQSPITKNEGRSTTNDQRITNNVQPVQASFTGQEPTTTNDQTRITNNVQPVEASSTGPIAESGISNSRQQIPPTKTL